MDIAIAVVAGVLLALVAFRRARRVPPADPRRADPRRAAAPSPRAARARGAAVTFLAAARVGVGIGALAGIVWLAVELFT